MDISQIFDDLNIEYNNEIGNSSYEVRLPDKELTQMPDQVAPMSQKLWSKLHEFVKGPRNLDGVEDRERGTKTPQTPFEFYSIDEVLNHLLRASKKIAWTHERDFLQGGLMYLCDQVEVPKYKRNQGGVKAAWRGIYPLISKYNLLEDFPEGSWSRERIVTFLLGSL